MSRSVYPRATKTGCIELVTREWDGIDRPYYQTLEMMTMEEAAAFMRSMAEEMSKASRFSYIASFRAELESEAKLLCDRRPPAP